MRGFMAGATLSPMAPSCIFSLATMAFRRANGRTRAAAVSVAVAVPALATVLATVLASCAAHQPAPAAPPPPAAAPGAGSAPDPFAEVAGKIVLTRRRLGGPARTAAEFVAGARADQTERI